jgi:DNA-binding response OmpR family regulator
MQAFQRTESTSAGHYPVNGENAHFKPIGPSVLVVEDEEMIMKVMRLLFMAEGYTVFEAGTQNDAVALEKSIPGGVDLLLADVWLKQGSGPGAAEEIRRNHPDVEVVFMSGYGQEELVTHGVIGAGERFFKKPFNTKLFREFIRNPWVVVDYQMPNMDGARFMLKARQSGHRAKFILLTGLDVGRLDWEGLNPLGLVGHLHKPLDAGRLVEMLEGA